MKKILVLCTGNSCRSQIAEGYLRHFSKGRAEIYSAGIEAHGVNPKAVLTMKEDGIDISKQTSNLVTDYLELAFDYVITVCDNAQERCPHFPQRTTKIHHNFPDPAKVKGDEQAIQTAFREVRESIKSYMKDFVESHL